MVTLAIFVGLATMMLMMVKETVNVWTLGERRRVLYERAAGALDRIVEDLTFAVGREPPGVDQVKVRFLSDYNPQTGVQRLMFVRSFESGPERAIVFAAGDGRPNELHFRPPDDEAKAPPPRAPDRDLYTGQGVGDFKALGGLAQVAYYLNGTSLMRAIRAPVQDRFDDLLDPKAASPLVEDALYLGFDYWSQDTTSWTEQASRTKNSGPEKIWDSTRGITVFPLNRFFLHRGDSGKSDSLKDPEDDVFPRLVRVTLTVDSTMPRCAHTKLVESLSSGDGMVYVDSTQGFPAGGGPDSVVRIGSEWIHYKSKTDDTFVADIRGARGTTRADHLVDDVVRVGRTFRVSVFIPGFREDRTSDDVYFQRLNADRGRAKK